MRLRVSAAFTAATMAALLLAPPASAQAPRVGVLALFSCDRSIAFYASMRELGYVEGRNIEYECVLAKGRLHELPKLAAELVSRNPSVIATNSTPAILAVQRATSTVPIVMMSSADAVRMGLVKSLAQPGGNTTGLTSITVELLGKRLELAREALPRAKHLAVLLRKGGVSEFTDAFKADLTQVAARTGFEVRYYRAADVAEARTVVKDIAREQSDLLYVIESPAFTGSFAPEVSRLVLEARLPGIAAQSGLAEAGLMLSYGPNNSDMGRKAARYVDRILKGAKPGDLPVEQPTKFELVVNTRTARALGIKIPQSVLLRADRLIE
jgi:putative ABC transport system substrate-binding protein